MFTARELNDVFEEDFADPDSMAGSGGVPDPLLAELGRARTGQMRDIVATIQGEQDTIIRAPLETCLVVQGGPGTGKTAVGLHRAAFLLYEHRSLLSREGVLVVGPNPVFLRYISQVLPSLGETSATQTTVDGLLGMRFRVVAEDAPAAAAVKGDARMVEVLRRGAADAIRLPAEGIELRFRIRTLRFSHDELEAMVDEVRAARRVDLRATGTVSANARATRVRALHGRRRDRARRRRIRRRAARRRRVAQGDRQLLAQRERCRARALAAHAEGGAGPRGRRDALAGRAGVAAAPACGGGEAWTSGDLPLLDEAEALVKGTPRRFGHVVVDEAQDLSPMQLRMLARRARHASMTVLGDLAQATGPASPGSWEETLAHLGDPDNAQRAELTMGYRLPGAFLELANRLLAMAAPGVAPSRSAREDGDPPDAHALTADELVPAVAAHAHALAKEFATVAVVAAVPRVDELRRAIEELGVVLAEPGEVSPDRPLVVVPAPLAKGLEFDAVIVVEPAEIMADDPHGVRLLFVALTRAVQHLALAHAEPLPAPLLVRLGDDAVGEGAGRDEVPCGSSTRISENARSRPRFTQRAVASRSPDARPV